MKIAMPIFGACALVLMAGSAQAQYSDNGYGRGRQGYCIPITTQATTQGPGAPARARREALARWEREAGRRFNRGFRRINGPSLQCGPAGYNFYCEASGEACGR